MFYVIIKIIMGWEYKYILIVLIVVKVEGKEY